MVEEQQHLVVVEAAGERQHPVPAAAEVEELVGQYSLGALAVPAAEEVDQCLPAVGGAEEGGQCSLAEVEGVEGDRSWRVEAAVGCL